MWSSPNPGSFSPCCPLWSEDPSALSPLPGWWTLPLRILSSSSPLWFHGPFLFVTSPTALLHGGRRNWVSRHIIPWPFDRWENWDHTRRQAFHHRVPALHSWFSHSVLLSSPSMELFFFFFFYGIFWWSWSAESGTQAVSLVFLGLCQ